MKKFVLVLFLLAFYSRLSAQQFSQYNTGTLYDSFENPAQRAFIPDSSRSIAFNFFLPNLSSNAFLTGNAQAAAKSRAFLGRYDENALTIGQHNLNYINANFNNYAFMLRLHTNVRNGTEVGLFVQSKGEGRGVFTDETAQLISNYTAFTDNEYSNIFNNNFSYQLYHQIGVSFRQDIDKQFSFGIKASLLLGVITNKVNVDQSYIQFDRPNDQAFTSLKGRYYASFEPGKFTGHDLLPSFRNPGASISIGTAYHADNGAYVQLNLKDLGFIHWNKKSYVGNFDNTGLIRGLSQPGREDSIFNTASGQVQRGAVNQSFTTPTNGKLELSVSKKYGLNYDNSLRYIPTIIASKELFYTGFTGALVNHLQYKNLTGTLTGAYNDMKLFSLGTQLMIKSPNAEFFIGTERLLQSRSLARGLINKNQNQIDKIGEFSGADFFIGFSVKMGRILERPENASTIPMGDDRSFIHRLWDRIRGRY